MALRALSFVFQLGYDRYPPIESLDLRTHSVLFADPNKLGLTGGMLHDYLGKNFKPAWTPGGWGRDNSTTATLQQLLPEGATVAARHQYYRELNQRSLSHFKEIVQLCTQRK